MTRRIFCKVLLVVVAIFGLLVLSSILSAQGNSDWAFEHVKDVQERNIDRFMAMDGVEGTAIGYNQNDQLAVKVFTAGPGVRGIPQKLDGVPVQVVVTGKIYALSATGRFERPVPIGVSTGNIGECSAGTIGCRVYEDIDEDGIRDADEAVFALSNNHVYALENTASDNSIILQPGRYDAVPQCAIYLDDEIGTLADFEPIVFHPRARNTIDAAIAITTVDLVGNATPSGGYGAPSSTTAAAELGLAVQKYGRTTGLTPGQVTGINATVRVRYDSGVAQFVGQIIIEPGDFSGPGDSGSLIVTQEGNNPVGLLFAGSSTVTIANPIDLVLSAFGVTVDSEEPATGTIVGTVTDVDTALAIEGATVTADGYSTTTAADGTYTLADLPVGSYTLTASATGYTDESTMADVTENFTTEGVDFALNPVAEPTTGSIEGTVTDGSTAISGATVSVDTGQSATTNIYGDYAIANVPTGDRLVTASADGFELQTTTAAVTDGGTTTVNFALNPVTTVGNVFVRLPNGTDGYATEGGRDGTKHLLITVALEDDLDNPVAGASVSIDLYLDGGESPYAVGTGTTGTDGTAMFKLANAPSGKYTTDVTNVTAGALTWDGLTPDNEYDKP